MAAVTWSLWPRGTELSHDSYDLAIALYRVCNQQDDEGLRQIQGNLDDLRSTVASSDASIAHLQRIVDDAQRGEWKTAMRDTRDVLEDQAR